MTASFLLIENAGHHVRAYLLARIVKMCVNVGGSCNIAVTEEFRYVDERHFLIYQYACKCVAQIVKSYASQIVIPQNYCEVLRHI